MKKLPEKFIAKDVQWHTQLDPQERAVIDSLIYHLNDDGVCWPSIRTIARETRMSESTVKRALARVRSYGIVTITPQTSEDGSPGTNLYAVHIERPIIRPVKRGKQDPDAVGSAGVEVGSAGTYPHSVGPDPVGSAGTHGGVCLTYEQDPLEPDPTPTGGTTVNACARAGARGGGYRRAQEGPPRGGYVLEVPRDLDWATGYIEAFWAAKQGWRTREAADHLWEQLRAIATEGGPDAMVEQLREGTAQRWRSIDAAAWRRYKRRRPGEKKPLAEQIREDLAFFEKLNLIPKAE